MQLENDIFISYAHIDDQSLIEGEKGWITLFHRALQIRLSQLLGREPKIWRDPKLQGNDVFADRLVERLPGVAALVSVISPRYVRSEWCIRELREFWKASAATGGPRIADKIRVFKVVKTQVPLAEHPDELQSVLGYDFYIMDPETGRPRELSQTGEPDLQKRYWAKLDDLAHDISDLLRALDDLSQPGPPAATPDQVTAAVLGGGPAPAGAAAPPAGGAPTHINGKGCVYLAETSFDLREQRDAIKRELQGHGYTVLPDRPLPLIDDEARDFVREQLGRAKLSVHLVGRNYGVVPEGGLESFVVLQNEIAVERGLVAHFPRLIWLPPGLESEDERQQKFIDNLQSDSRIQEGADILETSIEDFKQAIHVKLTPPKETKAEAAPAPTGDEEPVRIYLICDQRDMDSTHELEDCLFDQGFEVILPVFEGDESQVRLDHEENLSICDAVLLYYGAGNDLWLRRKLREVQKSAAFGRARPMIAKAVYTAPPSTPQKQRFRSHEAVVLHQPETFTPAALDPFIDQLKRGGS